MSRWRTDLAANARVLADPGGRWRRRMLGRMLADRGSPASAIRWVDGGVALLVVDSQGGVTRIAAGPEAGHLPDPAHLAGAVALDEARRALRPDS